MSWTRPVLCLLCECPASDGGVRVEQLDASKLSEWWRHTFGVVFDAETSQEDFVCQFCVWDARLLHDYSTDALACDWWSGHDTDQFLRKYYYQEEVIQPCKVVLGTASTKTVLPKIDNQLPIMQESGNPRALVNSGLKQKNKKKESALIKCDFCPMKYKIAHAVMHMKKYHKSENFVRCSYLHCRIYFPSDVEKQEHEELEHSMENKKKCIFCGVYYSKDILRSHLRKTHREQLPSAFKCTFRCQEFFLTKAELKTHTDSLHSCRLLQKLECIYCRKMGKTYRDKNTLAKHINYAHSSIKIVCNVRGCSQYFLSQTQLDAHFDQLHHSEKKLNKYKCSKCDFRSKYTSSLSKHVAVMHSSNNVECPECGKDFVSLVSLKVHQSNVHAQSKVCQYCCKKIVKMSFHQIQTNCKACGQAFMCLQLAHLHKMKCKVL